jgi:glycerophosphoryl diester phosphodiesterase
MSQTQIIAHRGFSGIAPENTLVAFEKAIAVGADYFELDVHKTLNDILMVIHDNSVDRTASNAIVAKVSETSFEQLQQARVGFSAKFGDTYVDEKVPTLRQALKLAKGKIKVCIEIKVLGVEPAVIAMLHELDMLDQVIVFSFHYQVLAKIKELESSVKTLYLVGKANALTSYYASTIKADAIGTGSDFFITKEYLDQMHAQGIELWQWTVNDEADMKRLLELGVDGIITNFPDKALMLRNENQ